MPYQSFHVGGEFGNSVFEFPDSITALTGLLEVLVNEGAGGYNISTKTPINASGAK